MLEFLVANGFGQDVVDKFEQNGLVDIAKFMDMDMETLEAECENIELPMKEYRRLKSVLREKKDEAAAVPAPTIASPALPKEVKEMMRPNAFTESLIFDNFVLKEVYKTVWKRIPLGQFRQYVSDMRSCWWSIRLKYTTHKEKVEQLFNTNATGFSQNVQRYTSVDVRLQSVDEYKLQNTINHVSRLQSKIRSISSDVDSVRKSLFTSTFTIKEWKSAEQSFYESTIKDLSGLEERLQGLLNTMYRLSTDVRRRFQQASLEEAAEKHMKRRKQQNNVTAVSRKKNRLDTNTKDVLDVICPNLSVDAKLSTLLVSSVDAQGLESLTPKHFVGLENLMKMDVFEGDAMDQVKERHNELKEEKARNSEAYKLRMEREKKKHADLGKQRKISFA